ncbi:ATP-binding protein [Vibrio breoganii]
MTSQFIEFDIDTKLVDLFINSQNGSFSTAVVELVSNCSDAEASEIDILITKTKLEIRDNGVGFQDKQQIMDCFKTLGKGKERHQDEQIGRFHVGRVQALSFGRTEWRSHSFSMLADYKNSDTGTGFELSENLDFVEGCTVTCNLYQPITEWQLQTLIDEISVAVKLMKATVTINGQKANIGEGTIEWTHSDEYCDIAVQDFKNDGIDLYSTGIYIKTIQNYVYGFSGIVNANKRLELNIARNQTNDNDPIFQHICAQLNAISEQKAKTERNPTQSAPLRAKQIVNQELTHEIFTKKFFVDARNRRHSMLDLLSYTLVGESMTSEKESVLAEAICESEKYLVLTHSTLKNFNAVDAPHLVRILNDSIEQSPNLTTRRLKAENLDDVRGQFNCDMNVIPTEKLTLKEKTILSALQEAHIAMQHDLRNHYKSAVWERVSSKIRRLRAGEADNAIAFTNTTTYDAYVQKHLKTIFNKRSNLEEAILTLAHEQAHVEDNHGHNHDFYELFHDAVFSLDINRLVEIAATTYAKMCDKNAIKLPPWLKDRSNLLTIEFHVQSKTPKDVIRVLSALDCRVLSSGSSKLVVQLPQERKIATQPQLNRLHTEITGIDEQVFLTGKSLNAKIKALTAKGKNWHEGAVFIADFKDQCATAFFGALGFDVSNVEPNTYFELACTKKIDRYDFASLICHSLENVIGYEMQVPTQMTTVGSAHHQIHYLRDHNGCTERYCVAEQGLNPSKRAIAIADQIKGIVSLCDDGLKSELTELLKNPNFIKSID